MRIAVSGSRSIQLQAVVDSVLGGELAAMGGLPVLRLGDAPRGVDKLALDWARRMGVERRIFCASRTRYADLIAAGEHAQFVCDWEEIGKRAGPVRNAVMLAEADALVTIWDGTSKGTRNTIEQAKLAGVRVRVYDAEGALCDALGVQGHLER